MQVIIVFLEEQKREKTKGKAFQNEAKAIANLQDCSAATAQKVLDLQGAWAKDEK